MPYVINKTNGEPLLNLDDGVLDTSTSVGLVGKNYVGYGETQNENFVHLLENFANINPPPRPIKGQNWFDTQNNLLKIYDGQNWSVVGSAILSESQPEGVIPGALWLKIPEKVLFVYDGSDWQLIGPENAEGFGATRSRSTTLLDAQGNLNPVILITVNGEVIAIISQRDFFISSLNAIEGFSRLFPGFNFKTSTKVYGDLQGLAQRATRLDSIRTINGVGFNGESDIVIKSTTEKKLKKGTYITGADFDGSTEVTWAIDASSDNIIGKLVARDSSGGFSASTIRADLIGNVQGNVNISSGTSNFDVVTANQFIGANLSGNARTASRLQIDRKINDVVFNGTQDITITASAQTLTGNSLNPTVVLSNLNQVGTLTSLSITDLGLAIGNGGQLKLEILNQTPTISTQGSNIPLSFRISDSQFSGSAGLDFIPSSISLANGGESIPTLIPVSSFNLGHPSFVFSKVHANNFIGNLNGQADTSLISTRSINLAGGVSGSIPYQTAANQTSFLPIGISGQVLKSGGSGQPVWGSISFSVLERGQYLTGANYDGNTSTVWSVDASPNNIVNKIVARDSSGNFSAGTITANLSGTASNATQASLALESNQSVKLKTPRSINGVSFDGTQNITIFDSTKIAISGGTMTGFLTLHANPVSAFHASTKGYVDSVFASFSEVKAWVKFRGTNGVIIASKNVNSVARTGGGRYTINIKPGTFANGNFVAAGMASDNDHFVAMPNYGVGSNSNANQLFITTVDNGSSNDSPSDSDEISVIMVG